MSSLGKKKLPSNHSRFIDAIERHNIPVIKKLLEIPNFDPYQGRPRALDEAVKEGNCGVIKVLLENKKIQLKFPNEKFFEMCIQWKMVKILELALKYDFVRPDVSFNMCGSIWGSSRFTTCLRGSSCSDSCFTTCFCSACSSGNLDIVKLFLNDKRVNPNFQNGIALELASRNRHISVVKLLLDDGRIDVNYNNYQCFINAICSGCETMIDLFLNDKRIDPSVQDNLAIRKSCYNGLPDIVEKLLKFKNVDPKSQNNYAIKIAQQRGQKMINLLLKDMRIWPHYYPCFYLICIKNRYFNETILADLPNELIEIIIDKLVIFSPSYSQLLKS